MRADITNEQKDQTIGELAHVLGADWRVRPTTGAWAGHYTRGVQHQAGYGVTLNWTTTDGRIEIRGEWPATADGKEQFPGSVYGLTVPGISVSVEKSAKAIAADITRRFLPAYLPVYAQMAERAQGADAYEAETARTAARIREVEPGRNGREHGAVYLASSHAYQVTAQGASVRFEAFSCPVELAVQVLKVLAKTGRDDGQDETIGTGG